MSELNLRESLFLIQYVSSVRDKAARARKVIFVCPRPRRGESRTVESLIFAQPLRGCG